MSERPIGTIARWRMRRIVLLSYLARRFKSKVANAVADSTPEILKAFWRERCGKLVSRKGVLCCGARLIQLECTSTCLLRVGGRVQHMAYARLHVFARGQLVKCANDLQMQNMRVWLMVVARNIMQ